MGITIKSNNFTVDVGYMAFNKFRIKVAELTNLKFGAHCKSLFESTYLPDREKRGFFIKYNKETKRMIEESIVSVGIANFCHQADYKGYIDQKQAKEIYEKIKDYDDDILYGYVGRPNCARFSDYKNIFKDCTENGGIIQWR